MIARQRPVLTDKTVASIRRTCGISAPDRRTGLDAKSYPANKARHPSTTSRLHSMMARWRL